MKQGHYYRIFMAFLLVLALAAFAAAAHAETLSWNAVTTYTDGSSIGTATVTYEAIWSTSQSLSSPQPLTESGTTAPFVIDAEGMPRGSMIYFSARATVGGVNSAWATPLSWLVPTKAPSAPTNLRMQ